MVGDAEEVGRQFAGLNHGSFPVVAQHGLLGVETQDPLVRVDRHKNRPHAGVHLYESDRFRSSDSDSPVPPAPFR